MAHRTGAVWQTKPAQGWAEQTYRGHCRGEHKKLPLLSQSRQHALHPLKDWEMWVLRQQLQRAPVPCNITATVIQRPKGMVLSTAVPVTRNAQNAANLNRHYPAQEAAIPPNIPVGRHFRRRGAVLSTPCSIQRSIPASEQHSASCCRSSSDTATAPC